MPRIKISAAVQELAAAARVLSPADRMILVQLLHAMGTVPPSYDLLVSAMRTVGITPHVFAAMEQPVRSRVQKICMQLEEALRNVEGIKRRMAVADVLVRACKRVVEERGRTPTFRTVLEALENEAWQQLLDRSFPGYPPELIGVVLCAGASIGSQSSKNPASRIALAART